MRRSEVDYALHISTCPLEQGLVATRLSQRRMRREAMEGAWRCGEGAEQTFGWSQSRHGVERLFGKGFVRDALVEMKLNLELENLTLVEIGSVEFLLSSSNKITYFVWCA